MKFEIEAIRNDYRRCYFKIPDFPQYRVYVEGSKYYIQHYIGNGEWEEVDDGYREGAICRVIQRLNILLSAEIHKSIAEKEYEKRRQ